MGDADHLPVAGRVAADAIGAMRSAAAALQVRRGAEHGWVVIDALGDRLNEIAHRPACPPPVERMLLDWRDRLGSYALAASAVAEADATNDHVARLLERAVREVLGEACRALADPRPAAVLAGG